MTPSIGIDLVDIDRFAHWRTYSDQQLRKLFSAQEIAYCRAVPSKSAERFAVRFAAKEALFKALAPLCTQPIPLLKLFAHIELVTGSTGVTWNVMWSAIQDYCPLQNKPKPAISTSLTHSKTSACVVVIISLLP